jgi:hypothetical protein
MTELLDKAFAELVKLPEQEQDAFAQRILDELAAGLRPSEDRALRRQDLYGTYADMFAELTAPYQSPLQGLDLPSAPLGPEELKELFKQALLELLQEQRDVLRDLLAEIIQDVEQARGR